MSRGPGERKLSFHSIRLTAPQTDVIIIAIGPDTNALSLRGMLQNICVHADFQKHTEEERREHAEIH